ncbi:unnamed protein product [Symbiodinium microadriaticum]|nr:unnamed protein product [Symbiodinium microadriaticum]
MALGIWSGGLDTLEEKVKSVQERFESDEPWVAQLVAVHHDCGEIDVDDFVSQLTLLSSPQTRRLQRCATPDCPYRVHEEASFGGYCCKQCHFVHVRGPGKCKGPQHGGRCAQQQGSHLSLQALAKPPLKPQAGVGCVVAGFSSLQRVERVAKPAALSIAEAAPRAARLPKATSDTDVWSRAAASRALGSPQEGAGSHDRSSSTPGGIGILGGEDDVDYSGLRDAIQAACSYTSSWPGVFLHQVSVDCDGKKLTALGVGRTVEHRIRAALVALSAAACVNGQETQDASLQKIAMVARRKQGERCLAGQPTGKRKREDMADVVENLKGLFAHYRSEQLSTLRDLINSVESPAKQQAAGLPKDAVQEEEFEEVEISEEDERRCAEKIECLKAERARQMASQSRRNKAQKSPGSEREAMPAPGDAGEDVRGCYLAPTPKQKSRPRPSSAPQISAATTPPEAPAKSLPKPKPMPCKVKKLSQPLVPKEPPYPPPAHLRAGMKVFTSPFSPDTRITAEPQFEKLAEMKESVQGLAAGPSIREVAVDELNFTQSSCGERFSDGRTFFELLEGLWTQRIRLSADFLVLDCVETSAGISSFNNRRLFVLKMFQKLKAEEVKVWCTIRRLDPNLESVVEMAFDRGSHGSKKQLTEQLNLVKNILRHRDDIFSKNIRVRYKS